MSQILLNSESIFIVDSYGEVVQLQKEMYENNNVTNFRVVKKEIKKKNELVDEYYKVHIKIENMSEKDSRGSDIA
ncbi:MAG: hypothetical protein KHZ90_09630 [Veillonella parvula]|uniref:Uncharacterized protein n=1 Tax=Veillonella parvula TaxID=29466 RepID=A0A942WVL3_VEIPA|nr:hypothetical protein [Veillonella parvula]MBS4894015.1 hypothetical protein [Veillonella parvula]